MNADVVTVDDLLTRAGLALVPTVDGQALDVVDVCTGEIIWTSTDHEKAVRMAWETARDIVRDLIRGSKRRQA